jgi:hypothetical protein
MYNSFGFLQAAGTQRALPRGALKIHFYLLDEFATLLVSRISMTLGRLSNNFSTRMALTESD